MENSTIVQGFLSYLNFEKRFSVHTAKCYGADLTQFGQFLLSSNNESQSKDIAYSVDGDSDGTATAALATQTQTTSATDVDQLLLLVDVNTVRS
ncbi:MAG: hypothetical protein KAI59_00975, partial [Planctomycetes bacterium]|nr:hypothetical protein [Planctomycetota bacterium]